MISLRINVYYAQLSLFWFLAPIHNLFTTVNKHQASTCCLANNSTNLPVHSDEDFSLFAIVKCQSGWDYGLGGVSCLAREAISAKMQLGSSYFPLEVG